MARTEAVMTPKAKDSTYRFTWRHRRHRLGRNNADPERAPDGDSLGKSRDLVGGDLTNDLHVPLHLHRSLERSRGVVPLVERNRAAGTDELNLLTLRERCLALGEGVDNCFARA